MGCLFIVMVFFGFIWYVVSEGGKIREEREAAEKTNPTCISDYTKCADNKELVERHHSKDDVSITVECKMMAKRMAKYGDPELPWVSFQTYYSGRSYIEKGVATVIEKDAIYKNAFNAAVKTTAICTYDLRKDEAMVKLVTD